MTWINVVRDGFLYVGLNAEIQTRSRMERRKMKLSRGLLAVGLMAAATGGGQALAEPSFDCAKAESAAEIMICEDAGLAELDRELAALYSEVLTAAQGSDDLAIVQRDQRDWFEFRDECMGTGAANPCVAVAYEQRIEALRGWLAAR
jgi:uncharacterized protein